jgi:hypothetical protein
MIDIIDLNNKTEMLKLLKSGVVVVTFKKKDGSERVMNASLRSDLIIPYEKKTERVLNRNDEVQSVFDVDLQEWRSFRWDYLIRFQFDW